MQARCFRLSRCATCSPPVGPCLLLLQICVRTRGSAARTQKGSWHARPAACTALCVEQKPYRCGRGAQARRSGGWCARCWAVRAAALRAFCAEHRLPAVQDPSNADLAQMRNRIRAAACQAASGLGDAGWEPCVEQPRPLTASRACAARMGPCAWAVRPATGRRWHRWTTRSYPSRACCAAREGACARRERAAAGQRRAAGSGSLDPEPAARMHCVIDTLLGSAWPRTAPAQQAGACLLKPWADGPEWSAEMSGNAGHAPSEADGAHASASSSGPGPGLPSQGLSPATAAPASGLQAAHGSRTQAPSGLNVPDMAAHAAGAALEADLIRLARACDAARQRIWAQTSALIAAAIQPRLAGCGACRGRGRLQGLVQGMRGTPNPRP